MVIVDPVRRLLSVALSVGRAETEVDAAVEGATEIVRHRLQLRPGHVRIDPGDQEPLAFAVFQQLHRRFDASRGRAGEGHNAVRLRRVEHRG